MNVLWVADFSLKHNIGGAQRSDAILIEEGRKLGHTITEFNIDSNETLLDGIYDLVVSSNLEAMYNQRPNVFGYILASKHHIRVEHDMNRYLAKGDREALFASCKKSFFLTQFHYDLFKQHYGEIFRNVEIVPDPIDGRVFFDKRGQRQDKTLYAGFMHDLKGTRSFFEYCLSNPLKSFVVAGWGDMIYEHLAFTVPNVTFLGTKRYEDMPELFNSYRTMFYNPVIPEPFCRTVGEALFCGMELMANDKIGCVHELKRLGREQFILACTDAPKTFWNILK